MHIINRKHASQSYVTQVPLPLKSAIKIIPPLDHTPEQQQVQSNQSKQQQKLNEIGKQINSILSQGNKLSRSRKGQIHRPQSELITMYDMGKNLGPRFKQQSQNDISYNLINSSVNLNSINSTNLNIRKKQVMGGVFELSIEDMKRGTETERSYNNNKQVRDSILESMKQNQHFQRPQKITLNKTSKDYSMSSGKASNQLNIIHEIMQFQKSVNDDNIGSQDALMDQKSQQWVFDKIDNKPFSSESQKSQKSSNSKMSDQKQLYISYLQNMQKKPVQYRMEQSPVQDTTKLSKQPNPYLNSSGVDLASWSSEKQDVEHNINQRVYSCYTLNQQSQSQSSFRNQDEKKNEKENSKSENTTSRNNKVVIQNYINERTPTKNLFNLKNFQSPKIPSILVSNSKVNSLITSMKKFNRSSDKQIQINCNTNSFMNLIDIPSRILSKGSQIGHATELSQQINSVTNKHDLSQIHNKLNSRPIIVIEDPNNTHRILGLVDFSVRMLNIYSFKINLIGKHQSPLSSISQIIFNTKQKLFYSASRDGIIKEWGSNSLQGTYKLIHQFRVSEAPLKLLLDERYLHIITSGQIMRVNNDTHQIIDKVAFQGHLRQAIQTPFNEIIIAINNKLFKYSRGDLMLQSEIKSEIIQIAYSNMTIYVMTVEEQMLAFKDGLKLKPTQILNNHSQLGELFFDKQLQLINETKGQAQIMAKNI